MLDNLVRVGKGRGEPCPFERDDGPWSWKTILTRQALRFRHAQIAGGDQPSIGHKPQWRGKPKGPLEEIEPAEVAHLDAAVDRDIEISGGDKILRRRVGG